MSDRSAKSATRKVEATPRKQGKSLIESKTELMAASPSSSLKALYQSDEFRTEWDNDIPLHVALDIIHLRRLRKMSQQQLAKLVGTSQSAIARIESASENITLATLQKIVTALEARCTLSLSPQELDRSQHQPWWETSLEKPK